MSRQGTKELLPGAVRKDWTPRRGGQTRLACDDCGGPRDGQIYLTAVVEGRRTSVALCRSCKERQQAQYQPSHMDLAELLSGEELNAVHYLKGSLNFEAYLTPHFWEAVVASILGGDRMGPNSVHDIEVPFAERQLNIEVKFSREGNNGKNQWRSSHRIFHWVACQTKSGKRGVDAFVLVGLDAGNLVSCWVVPAAFMMKKKHFRVTVPRARDSHYPSPMDEFETPVLQIGPEIARVCLGRPDWNPARIAPRRRFKP